MRDIAISDITLTQAGKNGKLNLSFREKIEIAKLLDKLGVNVIEVGTITEKKVDALLIKSIATALKDSVLCAGVTLEKESIEETWNALKEASHPRLQLCAPLSAVQMEYIAHKKPTAMLTSIKEIIQTCRTYTEDVEFAAGDATRSDEAFLYEALQCAIDAGASTITICDSAGTMLPDEFEAFFHKLYENVTGLHDVRVGVCCSNALSMADSSGIAAVRSGCAEVKTTVCNLGFVSLLNIANILSQKGDGFGARTTVRTTQLNRIAKQIVRLCKSERSETSPFDSGVRDTDEETMINANEDISAVMKVVEKLGYDLSKEDSLRVYEEFQKIAQKREIVSSRELDAIIATTALQVPPAYELETYLVNSGNKISAMAHLKLLKHGRPLEGIALGDGPIDASFLAVEQIVGVHYELDDFQIQAVTQGHAAMGETIVKLRSNGKLYSGRGISTDIVGASISAYINALNKIIYEEESI